jgi:CRISPR-associated protein Cas2
MFDLPVKTSANIREYTRFRKYLIKSGFMMMQESVYCKLALNTTVANAVIEGVKKNKASEGVIQAFTLTEKQYSKIEFITGTENSDVLNSDERLVVL